MIVRKPVGLKHRVAQKIFRSANFFASSRLSNVVIRAKLRIK
ncbi:MAG: hypothetical protein PHX27_02805 [Candidatus ainarchaeum sp.]|nr:hypothetical protein [Candidatus ainarchaeum sp.]